MRRSQLQPDSFKQKMFLTALHLTGVVLANTAHYLQQQHSSTQLPESLQVVMARLEQQQHVMLRRCCTVTAVQGWRFLQALSGRLQEQVDSLPACPGREGPELHFRSNSSSNGGASTTGSEEGKTGNSGSTPPSRPMPSPGSINSAGLSTAAQTDGLLLLQADMLAGQPAQQLSPAQQLQLLQVWIQLLQQQWQKLGYSLPLLQAGAALTGRAAPPLFPSGSSQGGMPVSHEHFSATNTVSSMVQCLELIAAATEVTAFMLSSGVDAQPAGSTGKAGAQHKQHAATAFGELGSTPCLLLPVMSAAVQLCNPSAALLPIVTRTLEALLQVLNVGQFCSEGEASTAATAAAAASVPAPHSDASSTSGGRGSGSSSGGTKKAATDMAWMLLGQAVHLMQQLLHLGRQCQQQQAAPGGTSSSCSTAQHGVAATTATPGESLVPSTSGAAAAPAAAAAAAATNAPAAADDLKAAMWHCLRLLRLLLDKQMVLVGSCSSQQHRQLGFALQVFEAGCCTAAGLEPLFSCSARCQHSTSDCGEAATSS